MHNTAFFFAIHVPISFWVCKALVQRLDWGLQLNGKEAVRVVSGWEQDRNHYIQTLCCCRQKDAHSAVQRWHSHYIEIVFPSEWRTYVFIGVKVDSTLTAFFETTACAVGQATTGHFCHFSMLMLLSLRTCSVYDRMGEWDREREDKTWLQERDLSKSW